MIHRITSLTMSLMPVHAARNYVQKQQGKHSNSPTPHELKQLLVDVSVISQKDVRTGIQRVVRAILQALLFNPPVGYRICPVAATRKQDYHYLEYFPGMPDNYSAINSTGMVQISPGDIFLGLDLSANILPYHHAELIRWKRQGARLHFLVYDLLAVLHPHWFTPKTRKNINSWLRTIAIYSDSLICISSVVKDDLINWLNRRYDISTDSISINTIPLGSDIGASLPSKGVSEEQKAFVEQCNSKTTLLMVGTLEPRKGHAEVLAVCDELWQRGKQFDLLIVGQSGWKTETLQLKLQAHSEYKQRLHWLQNASDELLGLLYQAVSGVIVASEAEGFGLPLSEALHYQKPVLARNIPVFREFNNNSVTYFAATSFLCLVSEYEKWIDGLHEGGNVSLQKSECQSWSNATNELISCIVTSHLPATSI